MKHTTASAVMPLTRFARTNDPRAPKANLSNADHLMGDAEDAFGDAVYGDADYGDAVYGDIHAGLYGDIDTAALNTYNTLIGDASEQGTPRWLKYAAMGVGAGAATYGISRLLKQRRARVTKALAQSARANTISTQVAARRLMGKVPRQTAFPFYQCIGATLNGYPISPTEAFAADTLKFNMDIQSTQTPFEVEVVAGAFAAGTYTCTTVGGATPRFYTAVVVTIGIAVLTANPGTIFTVAGTFPLVNSGTLTVSTNPWVFTIRQGYYAKIMIFPWVIVTNKPLLALGQYSGGTPIVVTVSNLPAGCTVNLVVPGSQHPWTIGMRNRLL